jgi:hypothetical protein
MWCGASWRSDIAELRAGARPARHRVMIGDFASPAE